MYKAEDIRYKAKQLNDELFLFIRINYRLLIKRCNYVFNYDINDRFWHFNGWYDTEC